MKNELIERDGLEVINNAVAYLLNCTTEDPTRFESVGILWKARYEINELDLGTSLDQVTKWLPADAKEE